MTRGVYLSLGSNLGDRHSNLRLALDRLPALGFQIEQLSPVYETEPVDVRDQPWFLNMIVQGSTDLPADLLMRSILAVERELGRNRADSPPKGPRLIDIDILLFGDAVIEQPGLHVPHPRLAARRFILVGLAAIEPQLTEPRSGKTVSELLATVDDNAEVRELAATPVKGNLVG